jgi:hypothetical protein
MRARDEYRLADKPGLTMRVGNTKGIEVTIDGAIAEPGGGGPAPPRRGKLGCQGTPG